MNVVGAGLISTCFRVTRLNALFKPVACFRFPVRGPRPTQRKHAVGSDWFLNFAPTRRHDTPPFPLSARASINLSSLSPSFFHQS